VDAIVEITSYAAYTDFSERLRKLGFTEDIREGASICRWRQKQTILDVLQSIFSSPARLYDFLPPLAPYP
jgi:hypothetical protein